MTARFLDREGIFILTLGAVALVALVLAGFFLFHPPEAAPPERDTATSETSPQSPAVLPAETGGEVAPAAAVREVLVPGEDGRTVLDLLRASHQVQVDTELLVFGSIIIAIDSARAAPDEYWVYYRDSVPGDRPPEACTTLTGETIRWVLKRRR